MTRGATAYRIGRGSMEMGFGSGSQLGNHAKCRGKRSNIAAKRSSTAANGPNTALNRVGAAVKSLPRPSEPYAHRILLSPRNRLIILEHLKTVSRRPGKSPAFRPDIPNWTQCIRIIARSCVMLAWVALSVWRTHPQM